MKSVALAKQQLAKRRLVSNMRILVIIMLRSLLNMFILSLLWLMSLMWASCSAIWCDLKYTVSRQSTAA